MGDFLAQAAQAVEEAKLSNMRRRGAAYIPYGDELPSYQTAGYGEKVQRIPRDFFMSVEFCHNPEGGRLYELGTYTPGFAGTLGSASAWAGTAEDSQLHRHDYYELVYVCEGRRSMLIENQEVVLEENCLFVFDMQCAHLDLRGRSEGTAIYLGFVGNQIDRWLLSALRDARVRSFFASSGGSDDVRYLKVALDERSKEHVIELMGTVFDELETRRAGWQRICQVAVLRILNHVRRGEGDGVRVERKRLRGTKLFHAVTSYIDAHLADVSLRALSDEFHYQEDYYARLISRQTGKTFAEYVHDQRMQSAIRLLVNTDMSVADVMAAVGYASHSYFYEAFRSETGMTPAQYRRRSRQS